MAAQVILPRAMLSRWGDGGYSLYVAVTGFAGYVNLADAGVQTYLSQRLTTLRASGEEGAAGSLAWGGLRALVVLAVAGASTIALFFGLLGHEVTARLTAATGAIPRAILLALFAQLASGSVSLAAGGWSTAVEQSSGRFARPPGFGAFRLIMTTSVILAAIMSGSGPVATMMVLAAATAVADLLRAFFASRFAPRADRLACPVKEVVVQARGGLVLMMASSTQASLQPAIAASMNPTATGVAIPGRTAANASRVLSSAATVPLWPAIAQRLAAEADGARAFAFWRRVGPLLTQLQLIGVLMVAVLAPVLVPRWLPAKSDEILALVPIYCVEQSLYAVVVPSHMLLLATGRFARTGAAFLANALTAVLVTVATIEHFGALGFALGGLAGTAAGLVPALVIMEWTYWRERGQTATASLGSRLALCLGAAIAGLLVRSAPQLAYPSLLLVVGIGGMYAYRRYRRAI